MSVASGVRRESASPFAVVASAQFESGPPAGKVRLANDDSDVVETCQEEAWEERRKKTTTTTRNVERRVQRQLVLEDGNVVEDTGPVVTEDTTENTVVKEENSDEKQRPQGQLEAPPSLGEGWVAVPGAVIISQKETTTTNAHDEVEDELETEEIQHCGDVTNKEAEEHVIGKEDLRSLISHRQSTGQTLALRLPQKKVVHESTRKKGTKNTVKVREDSKIEDGHVVTETERCVQHETYSNESAPDDGSSLSDGSVHEAKKETSHNLVHTKDEDLLEYYAVPKGGTIAQGVKLGEGMHVVSEDVHEDRQGDEDKEAAERVRKVRRPQRRDALTKKPLDYNQEEKTRKTETNRWLDHHFGSESGRSGTTSREESLDGHSSGGNRITITMSPRPASPEDVVDRATPSSRRWRDSGINTPTKSPVPPPPPPKPERIWSPSPSGPPLSPISPPGTLNSAKVRIAAHDIRESELTAARARLRSTGKSLTTENKENDEPYSDSNIGSTTIKISPKNSYSPPENENTPTTRIDPVYSSRFRSGKPQYYKRDASPEVSPPLPATPPPPLNQVNRSQSFQVSTMPWSSKHNERQNKSYSTTSYSNTIQSTPHSNSSSRLRNNSGMHRSSEFLDRERVETPRKYYNHPMVDGSTTLDSRRNNKKQITTTKIIVQDEPKKERSTSRFFSWKSPREKSPPAPPRKRGSPKRGSPIRKFFGMTSNENASREEAGTQTATPVPPPRTKRKKRPKSCYFFGQESSMDGLSSSSLTLNGYGSTTNPRSRDHSFSERNGIDNRNDNYSNTNSKVDRRYRTTTTITPTASRSEQTNGYHDNNRSTVRSEQTNGYHDNNRSTVRSEQTNGYHDNNRSAVRTEQTNSYQENRSYLNSAPKSTWTNTVDPRRRPRMTSEEERSTTLPRKTSSSTYNSPNRTYIFGSSGTPTSRHRNNYGSMQNVSEETNERRFMSLNERLNNQINKPVGRSQSFNIQPGKAPRRESHGSPVGKPLSKISTKNSSQYGSSPYLNLQSPNLIATMARTSSINRSDSNESRESPKDDVKKETFMKGLQCDAPELFNLLHGENETERRESERTSHNVEETSHTQTSSKSRYNVSPLTPTPSKYSAKIFTFGRNDNDSLTRTISNENRSSHENNNQNSSIMNDQTTTIMNRQNISMNNDSNYTNRSNINNNNNYYDSSRRKSTFNMKTPGSSLLFSPSFREKREDDRRISDARKRLSGDYGPKEFSAAPQESSPVLIEVRDWNTR